MSDHTHKPELSVIEAMLMHDLRTPLGTTISALTFMLELMDDAELDRTLIKDITISALHSSQAASQIFETIIRYIREEQANSKNDK